MADFAIRFFLCNAIISGIIGILLAGKWLFRNHLSGRMQFHLWFLLLGLLAVPFLPFRPIGFPQIISWLYKLKNISPPNIGNMAENAATTNTSIATGQINDFALSVSRRTPSVFWFILCDIWLIGILAMLLSALKAKARLNALKKSALPLQNKEIRILYHNCLSEMKIKRDIPIYSTAFLTSPVMVGLFRPRIYLPIHLISDFQIDAVRYGEVSERRFNAANMRYMLLHELQHYKHKDAFASFFMNLAGIVYWFNPLVWYALKEMRDEREIACDTSVLALLEESDYEDYANTLIDFAEKISLAPFPFTAGISGSMKQMQKRIIHISSYKKPSVWKKLKGFAAFGMIAAVLFGLAPMLSTYAADQNHYQWNISPEKVNLIDLSAYFDGYEGSFVLYDLEGDTWFIHDMDYATLRISPNSTYKIYDALFGLEESVITPEDSFIAWNGTDYPVEAWNADQNLHSAMKASVNWYFQEIDQRLGASAVKHYLKEIGYGNESVYPDFSSYWMQSSLKISPVEQVELLTGLYSHGFGFAPENINAVKDSICLFSSEKKSFYGKTGTGRIDGQDVNGWFVGWMESDGNAYFFATNLQSDANTSENIGSESIIPSNAASGSIAAEITEAILMHYLNQNT